MARAEARAFLLAGPPFAGASSFRNKQKVKDIGAKWSPELKKWCAHTESVLFELVDESVWLPIEANGDPLSVDAVALLRSERRAMDNEDSEKNAEKRNADAKAAAARERSLESRDLQIQPDEPELVAEALRHGVTAGMVETTSSWMELGPRMGLSNVGRIQLCIDLGLLGWADVAKGCFPKASPPKKRLRAVSNNGTDGPISNKRPKKLFAGTSDGVEAAPETVNKPAQKPGAEAVRGVGIPYRDAAVCGKCNTRVSGRLQFGLECKCIDTDGGSFWSTCEQCFGPFQAMGGASALHCRECTVARAKSCQ